MIFNKRHQLTFHEIFKNFRKQFRTLIGLKLFTSVLSSELLSDGVNTGRFVLFGKAEVSKLWLIIRFKDLYI